MDRRTETGLGNRAALFAALWTLIAVTLLSALAPLGPPLSRAKGSAFNPATSEVVVKARTPTHMEARRAVRPDGGKWPAVLLCIATLCLLRGSVSIPRWTRDLRVGPVPHSALAGARHARAPPALA